MTRDEDGLGDTRAFQAFTDAVAAWTPPPWYARVFWWAAGWADALIWHGGWWIPGKRRRLRHRLEAAADEEWAGELGQIKAEFEEQWRRYGEQS